MRLIVRYFDDASNAFIVGATGTLDFGEEASNGNNTLDIIEDVWRQFEQDSPDPNISIEQDEDTEGLCTLDIVGWSFDDPHYPVMNATCQELLDKVEAAIKRAYE